MELCALCRTIPLDSLPDFPPCFDKSEGIYSKDQVLEQSRDMALPQPDALGFPWHENLEQLAAWAASSACPICRVVQCGVDIWNGRIGEVQQDQPGHLDPRFENFKNEKLWLTRRKGGADGFFVLVALKWDRPAWVILISGVSLSVDADSPLAKSFPLRPIDQDSGSARSQDVAAEWLEHCLTTHSRCRHLSGDMPLPSRVIDVGGDCADVITLIECPMGVRGRYACLSHCWGSSMPVRTTRTTYAARMSGIPMDHLPRSFADAVVLTRRLKLRFLWIDSLCILQDDHDDWARESSRMAAVYSQAHVVLAANRAVDSAAGMFHIRNARPAATVAGLPLRRRSGQLTLSPDLVHVQLLFMHEEGPSSLDGVEPLLSRGWALQERVLARRVLHFNAGQMYYECCSGGLISEDGWHMTTRFCDVYCLDGDHDANNDGSALWGHLISDYCRRKLSNMTDKLPAMSGLASMIEGRGTGIGRSYVAGLWSDRLVRWLAWQTIAWQPVRGQRPATSYIGPTWSWASYDGQVGAPVSGDDDEDAWRDIAEVIGWHVEPKHEANPYGEVKDAWIKIRAPMTRLSVTQTDFEMYDEALQKDVLVPITTMCTKYNTYSQNITEGGDSLLRPDYEDMWTRDRDDSDVFLADEETYVLILGRLRYRDPDGDDFHTLTGLVLVPVDRDGQEPRTMKRVGTMTFFSGEESENIMSDTENRTMVTLV